MFLLKNFFKIFKNKIDKDSGETEYEKDVSGGDQ